MSKKRKSNHRGGKPVHRDPKIKAGEHRRAIVQSKDGSYVRVTCEYRSHSRENAGGQVGEALAAEMYGAARAADLRILATQRPSDIVEGEILAPNGRIVLTKWIPVENELLILQARPATVEDLATLDRYGEKPEEVEPRKAEARRLMAERERASGDADDVGEDVRVDTPSILEQAQA